MLNRITPPGVQLAKLRYLESDYQILAPGTHVTCAITHDLIALDDLKYWSFDRQEAYRDAHISLEAEIRAGNLK
ncbi:MAG: DUF2093 domain-containing protein [Pseudomonadota bacterium]